MDEKKKILKLNVNDAKHNTGRPKKIAPKVQLVISHVKHLIRPLYWIYTMELLQSENEIKSRTASID